ncbi:macrophage migration inhibitory factor-like [Uloborus diversus]|uniref:macrophage migration inhibitory factor-like n=1 Tax=Uloborus diversus TaxID=327109 RepID=UPI00240946C5|nr:macrophage migration inhibitory factor-like [Uloborus diversus]
MPTFTINTNVPSEKVPSGFLKSTAELVADVLKKPISYVVVHIHPDQMMSWGGTSEPCAFATLGSIGSLGKKQNVAISERLFPHIKENLGINPDRMYINFVDYERANVGYSGTTFAEL